MAFYKNNPELFTQGNLVYMLEEHLKKASEYVNSIQAGQFMASTDEQIIQNAVADLEVVPIELHVDQKVLDQQEEQVDVSHDPTRLFLNRDRPFYVPGTRFTISIPYTGQPELWTVAPGDFWATNPRANVLQPDERGVGMIRIVIDHPADILSPEPVQSILSDTLRDIELCLRAQRCEIEHRNSELPDVVRQEIERRRHTLRQSNVIADALNIPLRPRAGVPDVTTIPIKRRLKRPLPTPPMPNEPRGLGIADEDYDHILAVIRHEGRTFESTPVTYKRLGEEDLRNILLAHLNGHYEGGATGETFREAGKTDIRIEDQNRAAFVAECKLWRGAAEVTAAVDQLLSYLTWRDAKASLILFNKEIAHFSELPSKMEQALRTHQLFRADLGTNEIGEWRSSFASPQDPTMLIAVHAFIFNLYTA